MSGEDADSGEKSHAPTARRLEDARKTGDIPQSADATTAAAYGGLVLVAVVLGSGSLVSLAGRLAHLLDRAGEMSADVFSGSGAGALTGPILSMAGPSVVWIAGPAACVVVALVAQGAPVVAPSRLAVKFSRLSIIANLGQKFGLTGLVEFGKGLAKLTLMTVLLGLYLVRNLDAIVAMSALDPAVAMPGMFHLLIGLLLRVVLALAAIAVLDLLWQWLSFLRRNRMTRQQVIEEFKESEGDPMLRQQRRARAVAIATAPLRKAVAEADVVIVNPTHFAVALAWKPQSGGAPVCVAKGVDEMAARIRALAAEHGVPVHSDPPVARALFAEVAVGREIDRRHYRAVAVAIRFAERIRAGGRR